MILAEEEIYRTVEEKQRTQKQICTKYTQLIFSTKVQKYLSKGKITFSTDDAGTIRQSQAKMINLRLNFTFYAKTDQIFVYRIIDLNIKQHYRLLGRKHGRKSSELNY